MINFIKNNATAVGLAIAVSVIAYLIFNPRVEYEPIGYKEDKSKRDTTEIEKTVYDTVIVHDTVDADLDIPIPDLVNDSLKKYTTTYSDEFISGKITSGIYGTLEYQEFQYIRRVKHIKEHLTTKQIINRYYKPKRIYPEAMQSNRSSLWIGLQNESFKRLSLTPNIMYINNDRAYTLGYNLNNNSLTKFDPSALRFGIKIKF